MFKKLSLIAILFALANCAPTFNKSGPGIIYTDTTDAVFYDNNVIPRKKGKACSTRVLSVAALGDASTEAAKIDGNISKVASIDTEYKNYLGILGKACTVVRGE